MAYSMIKRGALYKMLSELTVKNRDTIKVYFSRNKLNVENPKDFLDYIQKYAKERKD